METNKIYQGDCLELMKKIESNSVNCIITDPPFGCNATLKGNYNDDESFIKTQIPLWLSEMQRVLKENGHIYVYVPTKYIDNWLPTFRKHFKFNNILVCNNMKKGVKHPNLFRNNYQMILYGSKGRARNFNKVDWILTSDSWFYDKRNIKPSRYLYEYPAFIPPYFKATVEESVGHPDEKNKELIKNLIKISTDEKDLILDCFIGSGTVAVACKNTNRRFLGFEISEEYCKIANERIQKELSQTKLNSEEVKQEAMQSEARHSSQAVLGILPNFI